MMRSSKGFTLDPLSKRNSSSMQQPDHGFSPAMNLGKANSYGMAPASQQFSQEKMNFLEEENNRLKEQVRQCMVEMAALKEENLELKEKLVQNPSAAKNGPKNAETTFITKGADNPEIVCENCSQEVSRQNYNLHYTYCVKNISKCPHCQEPCQTKELQSHIEEMSGTDDEIKEAALNARFTRLKKMQQHGQNLDKFRDNENQENSLMHFAASLKNKELIQFLVHSGGVNIDNQNRNGETPLHQCCGKVADMDLARYLVLNGATTHLKNALGDTPEGLARRCGHHDLALLLSASDQSSRASQQFGASMGSNRSSIHQPGAEYGNGDIQAVMTRGSPAPTNKILIKTRVGSSHGPGMRRSRANFNQGGGVPPTGGPIQQQQL